jgi:GTP diphosphokinase / guanosine-3',5'-bis(diphosphate) 3'-diphosphatase
MKKKAKAAAKKKTGRRIVKRVVKKQTSAKRAKKLSPAKKKSVVAKRKTVAPIAEAPSGTLFPYGIKRHGDLAWHLAQFERLLKKYSEEDKEILRHALKFAKERHETQVRKDGSPFIIHPVRIANIIAQEWGIRETPIVAAALLHDVIEDTQTTIREVKDGFGEHIGKLVDGLTMWPGSETPEVYLKRVARGPRELRIVKCADVLDNLRSWHECREGVAEQYTRWWRQAHDFALPMAETTLDAAAKRIREIVEEPWYLRKANMV